MHPRKRIGFFLLVLSGLIIGYFIKNVKAGLLIGLAIGMLAGGLVNRKE